MLNDQKKWEIVDQFLGFAETDPGIFHRKKWTAFAYIDLADDQNQVSKIFIHNRLEWQMIKLWTYNPDQRFRLIVSRVRKEDADLCEACLYQLHTILSKEKGYREVKELFLQKVVAEAPKLEPAFF